MADEDEVDVLGDFSMNILSKNDTNIFDNTLLVSQNTDLLQCDYTIHPQWLLDKPSANPALWYNNTDLNLNKQLDFPTGSSELQTNSITDESGWTEKEKYLLERGIDIFGKSNVNLSQFIGSRTPAQVRYFLNNFYSDIQLTKTSLKTELDFDSCTEETVVSSNYSEHVNEVLNDNQIPVSIEEVIAAVSTAKPTTGNRRNMNKKSPNSDITYDNVMSGKSLLKSNYWYKEKYCNDNRKIKNKKSVKFKFKKMVKVPTKADTQKKSPKKQVNVPRDVINIPESDSNGDVQLSTGNGLSVSVCKGEEVIKIQKKNDTEDSDTDIDIDVEDENDVGTKKFISGQINTNIHQKNDTEIIKDKPIQKSNSRNENEQFNVNMKNTSSVVRKVPELSELSEENVNNLLRMDYPTAEISLEPEDISDIEKFIFYEFFIGRPSKTPIRYLRIRNNIIMAWKASKPRYVTKTSIRHRLRQCGDVNMIGRIHNYLEQIGAINFGCEQTNYSRPLYDLVTMPVTTKEKIKPIPTTQELLPRQRNKKKYINDGEGGCTLTHDERGGVINTTVVNEEPAQKQRTYIKKPIIRLIYCRHFTDMKPQYYSVKLELSALILMDLHAHMYLTEVMGLIGGVWDSVGKVLHITKYIPCKNIAPSTTHCDMCPISQAQAADILRSEHLDILGWYHSHPTFAPEPSQQDIDTQLAVQQWIGMDKPCIGFILSPFSLHGALIASPFRCLIVDNEENCEDQFTAYKFKVDLAAQGIHIEQLLKEASRVLHYDSNPACEKSKVDFNKPYFLDNSLTCLDKYIYSVKMHLAKCTGVNKITMDAIVNGLSMLCKNVSTQTFSK